MALNQAGILSPAIGKVSGVVGFRWKDKAALRGYVIPANPNTPAQQTQRALFAAAARFSSSMLGQILQPFMDPFVKGMSAYNWCVKTNLQFFAPPATIASMFVTKGNLFPLQTVASSWVGIGHLVLTTWATTAGNNGLATDDVQIVVYDAISHLVYFNLAALTRVTGTQSTVLPAGHPGTNLHVFAVASQTIGSILTRVADSVYAVVV